MRFTKMQGLGNDYIYVNAFEEGISDPASTSRMISDRHTGVGADGLILIQPSKLADVRMEMYNADGSRGMMCGNGIRCVAKYAVERGLTTGPTVRIETDSGVKLAECEYNGGRINRVRIDMGSPRLRISEIPARLPVEKAVDFPLRVNGAVHLITCVSMGNPHAVVFVDSLDVIDLPRVGPELENAPEFPDRVNAHFVVVESPSCVRMKTWERGSGATRACGTGACAVCVAGVLTGRTGRRIVAQLPGGELELEWRSDDHVMMSGEAVEVFNGEWKP